MNLKEKSSPLLEEIIKDDNIFWIDEKSIKQFSRISKVGQMLDLVQWKEIEWLDESKFDTSKLKSPEVINTANIVLSKIKDILWKDPEEIRGSTIEWIAIKMWDTLIETWELESFVVWNYIKRIAYQVSNIHLRYERYSKHLENRELKIKNSIDNLTWLLTKESINNYIELTLDKKINNLDSESYWVILVDIDYFKVLNDNFWHIAWDIVLEEISKIFKQFFRDTDKVARWWWEEFLIFMKWGNTDIYWRKLDQVRAYIEKNLIRIVNNRIRQEWKINTIGLNTITISSGVTELTDNDCLTSVTKRADEALYSSKWNWRNAVTVINKLSGKKKEDCNKYCPEWCEWNPEIHKKLVWEDQCHMIYSTKM